MMATPADGEGAFLHELEVEVKEELIVVESLPVEDADGVPTAEWVQDPYAQVLRGEPAHPARRHRGQGSHRGRGRRHLTAPPALQHREGSTLVIQSHGAARSAAG